MSRRRHQQSGFTIIELMIATVIFSVFLLLLTMIIIQVTKIYSRGVIASKTQEAAWSISTEIARSIQFSSADPAAAPGAVAVGGTYSFCAGTQRYTFVIGRVLKTTPTAADHVNHVLIADNPSPCIPNTSMAYSPATQRELMPENMRLANLTINRVPSTNLYNVTVRVIYGESDLLDNPASTAAKCNGALIGSQFCAVSELTTTVEKRLD